MAHVTQVSTMQYVIKAVSLHFDDRNTISRQLYDLNKKCINTHCPCSINVAICYVWGGKKQYNLLL